jgi:hypothetical protein
MNYSKGKAPLVATGDFGINPREIELVRSHAHILESHVVAVTDDYYVHLDHTTYADLMKADRIALLKTRRIAHWRLMLKVDFDAIQADYLEQIYPRLLEFGFPPSIFTVAANRFAVEFGRIVEKSPEIPRALKHELRIALIKLSYYDLAVAFAARDVAYID